MKSLEVRVPHGLESAEVRRRLDVALVTARDQYADKVGSIDASWEADDRLRLAMDVVGMRIDSQVEIQPGEIVVKLAVPGMAGLFAGRIRDGIQERLGGLLAKPSG